MRLLAIPNVSAAEGSGLLRPLTDAMRGVPVSVLDVHSDEIHNRTVFTVAGEPDEVSTAMVRLAATAARTIDLTRHKGVHPRLGVLDVCPLVPLNDADLPSAVESATHTGARIGAEVGIPVYLYGAAARRHETTALAEMRRGGLEGLIRKRLPPDYGPEIIDRAVGVACVGARTTLIAFNVWLAADVAEARRIAGEIRSAGGGPRGIRALGLSMGRGLSQVSMNLTEPEVTGVDAAYDEVTRRLRTGTVIRTEIVGLVPERFMPSPDAQAARLMVPPGRSLESVLR